MSKIIALATADHHIHKFQAFDVDNSRLSWGLKALREILQRARNESLPVLFCGDLLHSYRNIETETNVRIQGVFKEYQDVRFIAIPGNHDMSERNTLKRSSPNHLQSFNYPNFHLLNGSTLPFSTDGMYVWGLPYMNNEQDLVHGISQLGKFTQKYKKGLKILLLHSDIPGAQTPTGFKVGQVGSMPRNIGKFFSSWDLVLCGHIHKPQKLGKNIYMLGCPIQQNEGDIGTQQGYWEIYNDRKMVFIPLDNYPKFIRLNPGEVPQEDINYYINPISMLAEENIDLGEFNVNTSKSKLAKLYCKKQHIKNKSKIKALIKILS